MRKLFSAAVAALALTLAAPATASVTLQVSGGILTGATGVDVGGTLYDVQFLDGTCAQVFGACDAAHFSFTDQATALLAAKALVNTVFLDGPLGLFDSHPELTYGCSDRSLCAAITPYAITAGDYGGNLFTGFAGNNLSADVATTNSGYLGDADMTPVYNTVFARFTVSAVQAVPEPTTWAMMLLGFGGIGFQMRRKNNIALSAA